MLPRKIHRDRQAPSPAVKLFARELLFAPIRSEPTLPAELSDLSCMDLLTNHLSESERLNLWSDLVTNASEPVIAQEADRLYRLKIAPRAALSPKDQRALEELTVSVENARILPVLKEMLSILGTGKNAQGETADTRTLQRAERRLRTLVPQCIERLGEIADINRVALHFPGTTVSVYKGEYENLPQEGTGNAKHNICIAENAAAQLLKLQLLLQRQHQRY